LEEPTIPTDFSPIHLFLRNKTMSDRSQNNENAHVQIINYYIRIHNEWIDLANYLLREITLLLSWPRWDYFMNPERTILETQLLHALYYSAASKALVKYYRARMRGDYNYTRPQSPPLPPQMGGRPDFWQIQQPADVLALANQPDEANIQEHPPFVGPHPPLDEPLVNQHETDHPLVVPPPNDIQHPPSILGHDSQMVIQQPPPQLPVNPPNQIIPHHPLRPNAPIANQVCIYYLENRCRYGDECRFSHTQDPTNGHLNNENEGSRRRKRGGRRFTKNKNQANQGEGGVGGGGS
jgi:hypothetical protein